MSDLVSGCIQGAKLKSQRKRDRDTERQKERETHIPREAHVIQMLSRCSLDLVSGCIDLDLVA